MSDAKPRGRGSLFGALFLILLGAIFLYSNLRPEWDPWPLISRYWPLLLIVLGLGKLWDAMRARNAPPGTPPVRRSGEGVAIFVLILLVGIVFFRGHGQGYAGSRLAHEARSVEAQGAESVRVSMEMPAGELRISGGATKLLDADFDYTESDGAPDVSYDASGKEGTLRIEQHGSHPHVHVIGSSDDRWALRLNNDLVRDLQVEMGAGRGDLNLRGLALTNLSVEMGAGELTTDLIGDWKKDVTVRIEGGAGRATVRLPKDIGVRVRASGGIGSIDVSGLRSDGSYYVNDAYGKSPVTMNVTVEGGVGQIRLLGQ
ncbi:MAG TPA: toast rack family protein [Candidatus Acidoferrales bacterium]|nr:toast rack family protein [Candidatus Acidoferrales bacterium]